MRLACSKALIGIAALALALVFGGNAAAQTVPVNGCAAAKTKCVAKKVKGLLGCHQKAEIKGEALDTACTDKVIGKFGPCFDKAETNTPCLTTADAGITEAKIDAFVLDVVQELDPGYPAPVLSKCGACKKKAAAAKATAKLGCLAKAFGKSPGTVDPACRAKAEAKFAKAFAKCEAKPPCMTTGDEAAIENKVDAFYSDAVSSLADIGSCGNALNDVGEACDGSTPSSGWAACGTGFSCIACNCACPTALHFAPDASDPATVLDRGWTGLGHGMPVVSNHDLTVQLACSATERPCGVCNVSGPIANAGAGELSNERCGNDTSIQCTDDAPCATSHCIGGPNADAPCTIDSECPSSGCSGVGTCQLYFGPPMPIHAGNVGTCVLSQFAPGLTGTYDAETGAAAMTVRLSSRVYAGQVSQDTPCPVCDGDGAPNDGVAGGTCTGGSRAFESCDGNGTTPGRPDFGTTSFDCPPHVIPIAVMPLELVTSTGAESKVITAASPNCTAGGFTTTKCACDTCNNANAEPCAVNADCPISGGNPGICGGRRCLGGVNNGAPCTNVSACPGGGACVRPGEPSRPNSCIDDCATPADGTICVDAGGGQGVCPEGPPVGNCSVASGHPQRNCFSDAECCNTPPACAGDPPVPGDCQIHNRSCFLDNGLGGAITATGMSDPPVRDVSDPTLASVFCVSPTSAPAVNISSGLPGPARLTLKGTATAQP